MEPAQATSTDISAILAKLEAQEAKTTALRAEMQQLRVAQARHRSRLPGRFLRAGLAAGLVALLLGSSASAAIPDTTTNVFTGCYRTAGSMNLLYVLDTAQQTTCPTGMSLTVWSQAGLASQFGTGSDGTSTLPGNTTLSQDMYYANLTVPAGVTLATNGFRVFVSGTLTLNGTIANNGAAGGAGGDFTAGSGGAGAPTGTVGGGGSGGAGVAVAGAGGPGTSVTNSLGGAGGRGRAGLYAAGVGGSSTAPVATAGGPDPLLALPQAVLGRTVDGALVVGGAGGGGAADAGASGGGGGGGIVVVVARSITGTGSITASGGYGGSSGDPFFGGNPGGGGGGGAVVVVTTTNRASSTITLSAAGGAAGVGGAGTPAAAGASGTTLWLS